MLILEPILLLVLFFTLLPWINGWDGNEYPEYACGEFLDVGNGVIESPLFPDPYPPQADCSWQLVAQSGHRIRLTSEYFSIEHQPECLWDYLAISDGASGEFGQAVYCGSEELNFLSESNVTNIYFHSDVSGYDVGFRIFYEAIPPQPIHKTTCNITMTMEGTITSPDYPLRYPSGMDCFYSLQAFPNYHVILEFTKFHVETAPCDFDKLEVYDGDIVDSNTLLGIFCGADIPVTLTSETSSMTLRFISDTSLQTQGFSALIRFLPGEAATTSTLLPPPTSTITATQIPLLPDTSTQEPVSKSTTKDFTEIYKKGCNITITATSSNISSPDFPLHYPYDITCVTKLRSDVNSTFLIRFSNFSIEEDENCDYDSLSIYQDGTNKSETNQHLLRRMCGQQLENPILSFEGHGLDLVFKSDSSTSDVGYYAHVLIAPLVQGSSCMAACGNGGNCTEILLADGAIDWMCVCPARFTGTLCEVQIRDTCWDITCKNNGVCRDDGVLVSCVCSNGYSGRLCEQYDTVTEGGSLYFTKMVGNMTVSVGSDIILECAVNDPTADVMWLFQDRIMTKNDLSQRVEVHPGGVVVIPEADDMHSGRYTCMAVTSEDLVERSMWIHLKEPCNLHVTKSPSNITIREGQTAMFQCYVPDADVLLWRKDGDIVSQGPRKRILVNNYLVINPVVETDAGQYTCAARSKNGCFAKISAYLTVETMGHGKECGRPRNKPQDSGTGRISSGREAPPGSAPWHVILREDRKGTMFCGGSLISPDTVLTAAHCVGQFEIAHGYPFHIHHIHVYLGTHHCGGNNGIFRQIKSYVLHEKFNDTNYNNDVAIFKLDSPVDYSDDVLPICLETPDFLEELLKPGHLGIITGCGSRYANGPAPTYLNEVQIPYVAKDICRERASAVRTNFTQGMFCAGYAKSMRGDACSGDSGGPYILEFRGRYILAGIVSWGVGCDRENHYGYYTSVAHYYNWIMNKIK
uniref:Uncharacterized protein n=1 Tax=Arion vulgaris TaxID=1028688 RepID=A0A0B7AT12_9EUPU